MDTFSDFSLMTRIESKVALVTGATSKLSLNLCYRLIDQTTENLTFILTAPTLKQTQDAIALVQAYGSKRKHTVDFDYLVLDFTDLKLVFLAYTSLVRTYSKLDYIFLIETLYPKTVGFSWGQFLSEVFTTELKKFSYPSYITESNAKSKDGMGLVFQANVFAPYLFISKITTLLQGGGKIHWFSSTLLDHDTVSFNDLQLLRSQNVYVDLQRLIDLLHFGTVDEMEQLGIEQYLIQPGVTLNYTSQEASGLVHYLLMFAFWLKTLFGLTYHLTDLYKNVCAPVHCAVSGDQHDFKIGSSNDILVYDEVSLIGLEEVAAYLNHLSREWNGKLKEWEMDRRETVLDKQERDFRVLKEMELERVISKEKELRRVVSILKERELKKVALRDSRLHAILRESGLKSLPSLPQSLKVGTPKLTSPYVETASSSSENPYSNIPQEKLEPGAPIEMETLEV